MTGDPEVRNLFEDLAREEEEHRAKLQDSVISFLCVQEAACEGKDRDLLGILIKEEQDHVRRLSLQARRR